MHSIRAVCKLARDVVGRGGYGRDVVGRVGYGRDVVGPWGMAESWMPVYTVAVDLMRRVECTLMYM